MIRCKKEKVTNQIEKKIEKTEEKFIEEEAETLSRKELIEFFLDNIFLTTDDIKIMRNDECCTSEIRLALALYRYCGTNPTPYVHNSEYLIHDITRGRDRIKRIFKSPTRKLLY